jgi:isopentenyldiphosphate isomerase
VNQGVSAFSSDNPDEIFDLVDLEDRVIGRVRRGDAHRDPTLIHRSIQVMVFDSYRRVLLQRRSRSKDLFPGYYCASASGHVALGEDYATTAMRETEEELGCSTMLAYVGKELVRSAYETEVTALFLGRSDGPFTFNPVETDGGNFFALDDIGLGRSGVGLLSGEPMTPSLMAALSSIFRLDREGNLDVLLDEL